MADVMKMTQMMKSFWRDESGATAIEYGLIAVFVSVVSVAAWQAIGDNVFGWFDGVQFATGGDGS